MQPPTDVASILVIGATGRHAGTGSIVVDRLLAAGHPVRAMVRTDDDRAAKLRRRGATTVQAALLEPGAVSSGALDDVTTYTLPDDPFAVLLRNSGPRTGMITPEQVAAEVVDAAEKPQLSLRIPIGDTARAVLAARHGAPDDVPFV